MEKEVKAGRFAHYKKKFYTVLGTAKFCDDDEILDECVGSAICSGTEGLPPEERAKNTILVYRDSQGNLFWNSRFVVTKTMEDRVIYHPEDKKQLVWRSVDEFIQEVNEPEYDYQGPRFRKV